jgi:uncharacterized repeat protein (TIGR01451 family)
MRLRNGRLFFCSGQIVNPADWSIEATFGTGKYVETDPGATHVFYLAHDGSGTATLKTFDRSTRQQVESRTIRSLWNGVGSLVWCGGDRLAFHTPDGIYFVRTSQIPAADLVTALALSSNRILAGSDVTLSAWVTNRGPATATEVFLSNSLPAHASLLSASVTQGTVSVESNCIVAVLGSLASNEVARLDLRLRFTNETTFIATACGGAKTSLAELFPGDNAIEMAFLVSADNDHDGLADDWEMAYFGSTNAMNGGPGEDFDGDGHTNLEEYLAGTDPTDPLNSLRIGRICAAGPTVLVEFHAALGCRYQLDRAPSLFGPWSLVGNVMLGQGNRTSATDTVLDPTTALFYRIRQLP